MAKTNSLEEIVRICEEKNKSAKVPLNMASFSKTMLDCPVVLFINEVLKSSEALMDIIRDEDLKVNKVELVDDFTGTMILTCSVLAKAFTEKVPVLQVLDTLSSRPSFLSPYVEPEGLKPEERLTVAGEEINQNDLDSLKCTSWLNDKTPESLSKGKASWILRQVHVPNFRNYVMKRLMSIGVRNTYLCDSLYCKDPKGRKIQWINCDVCSRLVA
ncbi:uncharacterized protein LOC132749189 [Ruditapes philippinarum]|uniref:uncharacterized protein LOC132749189 n=1 Tax=Ruditapes philippinarum TaxID=129788 RepID=UPI00295C3494|nr:uncharacterized protein LOC132749189 [Ruditapes philippinarum]